VVRLVAAISCVLLVATWPAPGAAAEYRLRVASLYDSAFASFLEGRVGWGQGEASLELLEKALDAGSVPPGVLLSDREVRAAPEDVAASFGARAVGGEAGTSGRNRQQWTEVRWEGRPGERVVWVIAATRFWAPEVRALALPGATGGLRYFLPYTVAITPRPAVAVSYPLAFLGGFDGRRRLWDRYLSRALDFRGGLAAVVGVNPNPELADHVLFVIDQPPASATFSIAVAWGGRGGPGGPGIAPPVPVSPAR